MALKKAFYYTYSFLKKKSLLLFWCSLLGGLLSCWLLGSRLLSCWFLGSRLLGSLWLLSCRLLGSLLWFLGSWLLCLWFLGSKLEGSCSLLSSSSSRDKSLGGNQFLEGKSNSGRSLGSINLVVGTDVLEDGLSGGSLLVTKSLDSSLDHG